MRHAIRRGRRPRSDCHYYSHSNNINYVLGFFQIPTSFRAKFSAVFRRGAYTQSVSDVRSNAFEFNYLYVYYASWFAEQPHPIFLLRQIWMQLFKIWFFGIFISILLDHIAKRDKGNFLANNFLENLDVLYLPKSIFELIISELLNILYQGCTIIICLKDAGAIQLFEKL